MLMSSLPESCSQSLHGCIKMNDILSGLSALAQKPYHGQTHLVSRPRQKSCREPQEGLSATQLRTVEKALAKSD